MNRPLNDSRIPLAPDDLLVTIAGLLCRIAAPPHRRSSKLDIADPASAVPAESSVDAADAGTGGDDV